MYGYANPEQHRKPPGDAQGIPPHSQGGRVASGIEALEAQKNTKEQELHKLQLEPSSLFEGFDRAGRSSSVLRPEEKIALFLELFIAMLPSVALIENMQRSSRGTAWWSSTSATTCRPSPLKRSSRHARRGKFLV